MSMQTGEGLKVAYSTEHREPYSDQSEFGPQIVTQTLGSTSVRQHLQTEGCGSSQWRDLSVGHGEGPQVFKSVRSRV